jgi:hypothetical protein
VDFGVVEEAVGVVIVAEFAGFVIVVLDDHIGFLEEAADRQLDAIGCQGRRGKRAKAKHARRCEQDFFHE